MFYFQTHFCCCCYFSGNRSYFCMWLRYTQLITKCRWHMSTMAIKQAAEPLKMSDYHRGKKTDWSVDAAAKWRTPQSGVVHCGVLAFVPEDEGSLLEFRACLMSCVDEYPLFWICNLFSTAQSKCFLFPLSFHSFNSLKSRQFCVSI